MAAFGGGGGAEKGKYVWESVCLPPHVCACMCACLPACLCGRNRVYGLSRRCMCVDFSTHPHASAHLCQQQKNSRQSPYPTHLHQSPTRIQADSTAAYTELAAVVRAWVKQFLDGLRRLLRLNLTVIAQGTCVAFLCVYLFLRRPEIHTSVIETIPLSPHTGTFERTRAIMSCHGRNACGQVPPGAALPPVHAPAAPEPGGRSLPRAHVRLRALCICVFMPVHAMHTPVCSVSVEVCDTSFPSTLHPGW